KRLETTPGNFYNFHPGSHVGQGVQTGIELCAALLNFVLKPSQHTTVLIETMSGKGTEIGRTFQEIAAILERVELQDHIGVCLDTCHIWDGGYDIVAHLDDVIAEFDDIIGLDRLKAIHLNDSMNPRSSHKDRHARIGEGVIGLDALTAVINHPVLCRLPFILETPNDNDGYAKEISLLRKRWNPQD
nr:deoxyribonuclease IV [Schwartzia sp. (in: firmicutes)]